MKTNVRIWSKVRWKLGGVCVRDPGYRVEYGHDVGVFEDWEIMTRMKI